jgi:ribosomal protein L11 methyltransferase
MDMAKDIVTHLRPGAVLVLSGLLTTQASDVAKAYTDQGLAQPLRMDREEWSALVWA